MIWLMFICSIIMIVACIFMFFVVLAMYDHIKIIKFVTETFVTTVQKLCDGSLRDSKNLTANIMAIKDVLKDTGKLATTAKTLESIASNLSTTETSIKAEITKIKKGL